MTALERFMSTAKGLAIGGVVTAVLYPTAHAAMASYVDARFKTELSETVPLADYEDVRSYISPFSREIARLEKRMAVLDKAQEKLSDRHADLEWAADSLAEMFEEMVMLVPDPSKIEARQYLGILVQVMENWIEEMKSRTPGGQDDEAERSVISIMASGSLKATGGLGVQDWTLEIAALEHRIKAMADSINAWTEENARIEQLLGEMAEELDKVVRLTADPSSDLEEAFMALDRFGELLAYYDDPDIELIKQKAPVGGIK